MIQVGQPHRKAEELGDALYFHNLEGIILVPYERSVILRAGQGALIISSHSPRQETQESG